MKEPEFLPESVQQEIIDFCNQSIDPKTGGMSKMFFSAESFGLKLYLRIFRLRYIPVKNEPIINTDGDATALVVASVGLQSESQGRGYFSILLNLIESNCSKHKLITFESVYDGDDATLPHILLKKGYKRAPQDTPFDLGKISYWYKKL
jgi:hypothetical protein